MLQLYHSYCQICFFYIMCLTCFHYVTLMLVMFLLDYLPTMLPLCHFDSQLNSLSVSWSDIYMSMARKYIQIVRFFPCQCHAHLCSICEILPFQVLDYNFKQNKLICLKNFYCKIMFYTEINKVFELNNVYILRACWAICILIDTLHDIQIRSKPQVLRIFMHNFSRAIQWT